MRSFKATSARSVALAAPRAQPDSKHEPGPADTEPPKTPKTPRSRRSKVQGRKSGDGTEAACPGPAERATDAGRASLPTSRPRSAEALERVREHGTKLIPPDSLFPCALTGREDSVAHRFQGLPPLATSRASLRDAERDRDARAGPGGASGNSQGRSPLAGARRRASGAPKRAPGTKPAQPSRCSRCAFTEYVRRSGLRPGSVPSVSSVCSAVNRKTRGIEARRSLTRPGP
jgi:hypothetical protein